MCGIAEPSTWHQPEEDLALGGGCPQNSLESAAFPHKTLVRGSGVFVWEQGPWRCCCLW